MKPKKPKTVGNPHSVGGKPITFTRQVLALLAAPFLMEGDSLSKAQALFPADAIARARQLLSYFPGGVGAYSDSRGAPGIREEVAAFITKRDGGVPSDAGSIFLTEGASPSVKYILNALLRDARDGILTPILAPAAAAGKGVSGFTVKVGSAELKIGQVVTDLINLIVSFVLVVFTVSLLRTYVLSRIGAKRRGGEGME